jgi:hypothetical protein
MLEFIWLSLISGFMSFNHPPEFKIILSSHKTVWKDSSDMIFHIELINQSGIEKKIFDQVLDDVYNYRSSPLDNLSFVSQQLEKNVYKGFRDISFSDGLDSDFRTDKECMDSVERIRNPYIQLMSNDTVYIDYSFMYGRFYPKGKYRIKVVYKYDFTGARKTVESDWFYFEVKNDLFMQIPKVALPSEKKIFWQLKKNKTSIP